VSVAVVVVVLGIREGLWGEDTMGTEGWSWCSASSYGAINLQIVMGSNLSIYSYRYNVSL
jgi:hypothetical protein